METASVKPLLYSPTGCFFSLLRFSYLTNTCKQLLQLLWLSLIGLVISVFTGNNLFGQSSTLLTKGFTKYDNRIFYRPDRLLVPQFVIGLTYAIDVNVEDSEDGNIKPGHNLTGRVGFKISYTDRYNERPWFGGGNQYLGAGIYYEITPTRFHRFSLLLQQGYLSVNHINFMYFLDGFEILYVNSFDWKNKGAIWYRFYFFRFILKGVDLSFALQLDFGGLLPGEPKMYNNVTDESLSVFSLTYNIFRKWDQE